VPLETTTFEIVPTGDAVNVVDPFQLVPDPTKVRTAGPRIVCFTGEIVSVAMGSENRIVDRLLCPRLVRYPDASPTSSGRLELATIAPKGGPGPLPVALALASLPNCAGCSAIEQAG
jgi:hypothetical protein